MFFVLCFLCFGFGLWRSISCWCFSSPSPSPSPTSLGLLLAFPSPSPFVYECLFLVFVLFCSFFLTLICALYSFLSFFLSFVPRCFIGFVVFFFFFSDSLFWCFGVLVVVCFFFSRKNVQFGFVCLEKSRYITYIHTYITVFSLSLSLYFIYYAYRYKSISTYPLTVLPSPPSFFSQCTTLSSSITNIFVFSHSLTLTHSFMQSTSVFLF